MNPKRLSANLILLLGCILLVIGIVAPLTGLMVPYTIVPTTITVQVYVTFDDMTPVGGAKVTFWELKPNPSPPPSWLYQPTVKYTDANGFVSRVCESIYDDEKPYENVTASIQVDVEYPATGYMATKYVQGLSQSIQTVWFTDVPSIPNGNGPPPPPPPPPNGIEWQNFVNVPSVSGVALIVVGLVLRKIF